MELYQLKTLVTVAEERHLTRAAERMHASQPSLSNHIRALEREFETRLFVRTPKGMELTHAGRRLLPKAREVLAAAESFGTEARLLSDELVGDVRIGLNTDAEYLRIVQLLGELGERHPRITLQFFQSSSGLILDALRQGRLDAGFVFGPFSSKDLDGCHLEQTVYYAACSEEWAQEVRDGDLSDLAALPWIQTAKDCPCQSLLDRILASRGLKAETTVQVDGDEVTKVLVAAGRGVGVLRRDEAEAAGRIGSRVYCHEVEGLEIPLSFAHGRRRDEDPVLRAVVEAVERVWNPTPKQSFTS